MGLFDKLNKMLSATPEEMNNKLNSYTKKLEDKINSIGMPKDSETSSSTNDRRTMSASEKYKNKVYKMFYAEYPEKPFISLDREKNTNWIEQAKMFPQASLVKSSMMKRYSDGLLPGHIYMLYWIKSSNRKRIPSYFEYKYGIEFEKEKLFLIKNGYLNENNKITEKGEAAIQNHYNIIEEHKTPKPSKSSYSIEEVSKQIFASRDNILRNGFKQYEFVASRNCCDTCKKLDEKHFNIADLKIGVNAPPMHEGCTCSIAPYSDRKEYDAWLNHLSKGGTTQSYNKRKKRK